MKPLRKKCLALAVSTTLLIGCASQPGDREEMARAVEGYIEDVDKLFVVDCLLPGQVRKLGSQMTYLSARRPIRTTAADCEVRGGEYVAYDRANYSTALNVWLPKAQEGDATAQLYVGQIYEKGLGQAPDYRKAAEWYRKAAEQGNAQAQINLGHLYEKGAGVPKDSVTAARWYQKAAGLEGSELSFVPAIAASEAQRLELETLRQAAERSRLEVEELRSELNATRRQLQAQQDALRKSQEEIDTLRERLARQKAVSTTGDDPKVRELEEELRQKTALLKAQQAKVSQMTAAFGRERQKLKQELAAAQAQAASVKATSETGPATNGKASNTTRKRLDEAENALQAKMEEYQRKSAELTAWLTQVDKPNGGVSRAQIDRRKSELQNQAREIAALKETVEQLAAKVQEQPSPEMLAQAGPLVEIIDPPVTMTRGARMIQIGPEAKEIVGKVESSTELLSLIVNDKPLVPDASGIFRYPLNLGDPSGSVKITATDKKNKVTSLDFTLVGPSAKSVETTATAPVETKRTGRPTDIDFGKFYALIIGNNSYVAYPGLQTPINDAKSLDVILRERYGFHTKLLLNANRHQIMTALNEIHKKLTANDNLLIYYAGHGEIDPATNLAYWLPTDAEVGNPANWISSQSITELLSIMPARHVLVVADSCYSGAMTGSAVAKLPDTMDESKRTKWLKIMATRKARMVLTSGGVKPVLDQGGGGHSVFANAFLGVLRANKGILEDYDVFRAVAGQVKASAAKAGFEQVPQYAPLQHAGHEGSPFFFVPSA
ncbi:caspase family protein [Methylocaldum szegediense]|uniref:Sel1 repeat-containing protein n=1 Tax=Methylocaldum szegediense TaxID=73780 RepID=A0ABM9HZX5_9GAMM|nr:caspase family protein [Methylocaldum szegediense]CAI8798399.1 Sel1 repeat-containing protein [Methylocaldum szegediense]